MGYLHSRLDVHQAEVTIHEKATHHPREAENNMSLQPMLDTIANDVVSEVETGDPTRFAVIM